MAFHPLPTLALVLSVNRVLKCLLHRTWIGAGCVVEFHLVVLDGAEAPWFIKLLDDLERREMLQFLEKYKHLNRNLHQLHPNEMNLKQRQLESLR